MSVQTSAYKGLLFHSLLTVGDVSITWCARLMMMMMMDSNLCLKYTNRRRRWMNRFWESKIDGEYFKMCKILREFACKFRECYRMNITTDTKYINNQQIQCLWCISFTVFPQHVSAVFGPSSGRCYYKNTNVQTWLVVSTSFHNS